MRSLIPVLLLATAPALADGPIYGCDPPTSLGNLLTVMIEKGKTEPVGTYQTTMEWFDTDNDGTCDEAKLTFTTDYEGDGTLQNTVCPLSCICSSFCEAIVMNPEPSGPDLVKSGSCSYGFWYYTEDPGQPPGACGECQCVETAWYWPWLCVRWRCPATCSDCEYDHFFWQDNKVGLNMEKAD